ncbi:high-affinity branched-chain amino acid ABC transporter ATP-binding protein LivG [Suttonella sp. R2A3]|uniref:high-affinity branched-chain amino acid ABC transporter ATP-binding protein LivG n=1 Tax=Suttonella sp. R2A3 TaxID=2908648 RepID=UPI001F3C9632|nr:high-affinity branched-chain amino acid ABC transporter ATP-binding protein LivG [Suttonella sp. R2A3]UJF24372.1 high-affinity branched-chain amino acid ABC transporter ATP-binding protein LivG [Suttonella sp. R2A3]
MKSLLSVNDLRMVFGGLVAVDAVTFHLYQDEISSIIGPNGAGKTTVFNCISGFYKPSGGTVTLDSEDITGKPSHVIAQKGLTRTFQNIRLFKDMTVLENLLIARHHNLNKGYFAGIFGSGNYRRSENKAKQLAAQWLEFFSLRQYANHEAGNLAYGQQRRLEIARCMMTEPKVLILDEPAAGLNPNETVELVNLIRRLRDEFRISVLLIEHDMSLVMPLSEQIMVMEYGRPIAIGSPEDIRNNPDVIRAYLGEEA